jgi:ubiquinone/menaquinone biosynthesis C-methylase UbiE
MPSVLRRLVDLNVRASEETERRLRLRTDKTLWQAFEREAGRRIRALPDGAVVADVGGGRRCVYAAHRSSDIKLIALDISAEELALNDQVDETYVADLADEVPLPDASVDLVLSRAVLEHVHDVRRAATNLARVAKPGGVSLHFVPCRYSLFGIAARILPFKPLLFAVHKVMPWTKDQVEFDVYYDQGHPAAMERAFRDAGFREVETEVTWAQGGYFVAVYPAFLLHAAYEAVMRRLRVRSAASYMIVRATR